MHSLGRATPKYISSLLSTVRGIDFLTIMEVGKWLLEASSLVRSFVAESTEPTGPTRATTRTLRFFLNTRNQTMYFVY